MLGMSTVIQSLRKTWDTYSRKLRKKVAKKHPYVSIASYINECPDKTQLLSTRTEHLVYATAMNNPYAEYAGKNAVEQSENVILHKGRTNEVRTVLITNATCYAYSDVVLLEDGRCLYEIKEREETRSITNFMDNAALWQDTEEWCKIKPCKKKQHIKSAIKIGGLFGFNFYHVLFQSMPKLFYTDGIDKNVPIFVERKVAEIGNLEQLLRWLNKDDREVLYMDEDVAYEVDELYIVSSPNLCIPNFRDGQSLYEPKAQYSVECIERLSKELLPRKADIKTPEKIYICRRKATSLRGYNEEEVFEAVRQVGYVDVYPEQMSISEQIALFHNAKEIIAPEGAALSNLMFIQPECKVIILYCMPTLSSEFASLVKMRGASITEIYDVPNDIQHASIQRSYRIEPDVLLEVLNSK